MTFSERNGFAPTPQITIREDAPDGLPDAMIENAYECGLSYSDIRSMLCRTMAHKINDGNRSETPIRNEIFIAVRSYPWYKVYDVAENLLYRLSEMPYIDCKPDKYVEKMNELFVNLGIGWELKQGEGIVFRGDDAFQSATAETANILQNTGRKKAASEIKEAIKGISRRPKPDITGAISHAMAALECVARDILMSKKALGKIAKNLDLPKPLDDAVANLYRFSSQHARHVSEESRATRDDAVLVVHISCAVSTYLSKKYPRSTKKNKTDFG